MWPQVRLRFAQFYYLLPENVVTRSRQSYVGMFCVKEPVNTPINFRQLRRGKNIRIVEVFAKKFAQQAIVLIEIDISVTVRLIT